MNTNKDLLVMQSVKGKIHSPIKRTLYKVDSMGNSFILPATGGITYNYQIGDNCMNLVGDHVEPGVSIRNENIEENNALISLSCVGNEAIVTSGEAKGAKGFVTGKHGGIEHTLLYFEKEDLFKMDIDDTILIRSYGQGLEIKNYEHITCMNLDPKLLEKMEIILNDDGSISVPVVTEIPSKLMGSGIGSSTGFSGDYDIMTGDEEENKKYNINNLRFGDIVLLKDCDNTFGRQHKKGAVTVGIIVHSNCKVSGHGPGVTTLLSCRENKIKPIIDKDANISNYLL